MIMDKKINYAEITKELLGDELYNKFITEIAKEYNGTNLLEFSKQVVEKCCSLIFMIGMAKNSKMNYVTICLENEMVKIYIREFARKYEDYTKKIGDNMF
mgnify:CR=1 FL=1